MCYSYQNQPKRWLDANNACKAISGQLATVDRDSLNNFLYKKYKAYRTHSLWIGVKTCHGKLCFPDGRPAIYQRWNSGEQNNVGGREYYVLMTSFGYWNYAPAEYKSPFVCEIPGIYLQRTG